MFSAGQVSAGTGIDGFTSEMSISSNLFVEHTYCGFAKTKTESLDSQKTLKFLQTRTVLRNHFDQEISELRLALYLLTLG